MDTEQKLADAESRISAQNSRIARAQIEREQAQERLDGAKAALKEEFDATTGADIKRIRQELQDEIDAEVAKIEAELEAAGA